MGAAASAGPGGGGPSPDCYFCHVCKCSFEFLPGVQSDGRESEAPDICTQCGAEAIELVRKGRAASSAGGGPAFLLPATDTLHQFVMASGGAVSGHELLMNMLAFSDGGLHAFGAPPSAPGDAATLQESFESSPGPTERPTPPEVVEALPDRPLGMAVLEREPECAVRDQQRAPGLPACLPWLATFAFACPGSLASR
jgi:hypothetical protein